MVLVDAWLDVVAVTTPSSKQAIKDFNRWSLINTTSDVSNQQHSKNSIVMDGSAAGEDAVISEDDTPRPEEESNFDMELVIYTNSRCDPSSPQSHHDEPETS